MRKLQEKTTKSPWAQAPRTLTAATYTASLAEIQRLEREKKAVNYLHLLCMQYMSTFITFLQEEQRHQQLMQQQSAQQKAVEAAQEASAIDSSKRLQFKWAEKAIASKLLQVKSLAQIQQEEQERVAKVKVLIALNMRVT